MPRWRDNVEGAALRQLFQTGAADPHNTMTTEHMNMIRENNMTLFGHITTRNFHKNYRACAANHIVAMGANGARRRSGPTQGGATPPPPAAAQGHVVNNESGEC